MNDTVKDILNWLKAEYKKLCYIFAWAPSGKSNIIKPKNKKKTNFLIF